MKDLNARPLQTTITNKIIKKDLVILVDENTENEELLVEEDLVPKKKTTETRMPARAIRKTRSSKLWNL